MQVHAHAFTDPQILLYCMVNVVVADAPLALALTS
jgi:hypothetical protein